MPIRHTFYFLTSIHITYYKICNSQGVNYILAEKQVADLLEETDKKVSFQAIIHYSWKFVCLVSNLSNIDV